MQGVNRVAVGIVLVGLMVAIGVTVYALQLRSQRQADLAASVPTAAVLPTLTPSVTRAATRRPPATLPPTFTDTPTVTPTFTLTPTPSFTPSPTPTLTETPTLTDTPISSETPTATLTPSDTNTPNVPSPTPTETRSPFPFQLRGDEPIFTSNTYNSAGCAFQGIGGQVLDETGRGINDPNIVVVAIDDNGREYSARAGADSIYGDKSGRGGYEIAVASSVNGRTYRVQVRTSGGTELSTVRAIRFPSSCEENVALMYWIQTRPF